MVIIIIIAIITVLIDMPLGEIEFLLYPESLTIQKDPVEIPSDVPEFSTSSKASLADDIALEIYEDIDIDIL